MNRRVVDSERPNYGAPAVGSGATGTPWRTLLDEEFAPGGGCDGAALERHLEILLRVCESVQFAHVRGFVHLDLRPENVLVHGNDSIDLLGWDAGAGDADPHGPTGPAAPPVPRGDRRYWPPELAALETAGAAERGEAIALWRAADVYELGALLREIVTGEPSRDDGDATAATASETTAAPTSEPRAGAPRLAAELAVIWATATATRAELRHATVEALRLDVAEALTHARSRRTAAEGTARVDELASLLEGATREHPGVRPGIATVMRAYALIGAGRRALLDALRLSPANAEAPAQLQRLADLVTAFELAHGDHGAALRIVAELGPYLPDGGARYMRELAKARDGSNHIAHAPSAAPARDSATPDSSAESRGPNLARRAAFIAAWSTGAGLLYLPLGWLTRSGRLAYPHLLFAGINALMTIALLLRREHDHARLGGDENASRTRLTFLAATMSATVVFPVAWLTGVPFGWAMGMQLLTYALLAFLSAHTIDPSHRWAALPHALGFAAALKWPAFAWEALGAASVLAAAWQPHAAKAKTSSS